MYDIVLYNASLKSVAPLIIKIIISIIKSSGIQTRDLLNTGQTLLPLSYWKSVGECRN